MLEIRVVFGIPGGGKTRAALDYINNHPDERKVYLSALHDTLTDHERWLSVDYRHWQGHSRICEASRKSDLIGSLIEGQVPIKWICSICDSKYDNRTCQYREQFINPPNTILAPTEFLFGSRIRDYKPQVIFADDVSLSKHTISVEACREYIAILSRIGILASEATLESVLSNPKQVVRRIEAQAGKSISQISESGSELWLKSLFRVNPRDLIKLRRLMDLYGIFSQYCVPYLFPLFDLAKKSDVTIIDAIPNKWFLEQIARRYDKEEGTSIDFKYEEISHPNPADSTITRVRSHIHADAWYPKISLINPQVQSAIKARMESILDNHFKDRAQLSVGIITYKDLVKVFEPDYVREVRTLHYKSLRGQNTLEGIDLLFKIGTYNENLDSVIQNYELFFMKKPDTKKERDKQGGYRYLNKELETFSEMCSEYEDYQSVHRARIALNAIPVYVFGKIPKWLNSEFQVEEITLHYHGGTYKEYDETKFWNKCKFLIRDEGGTLELTELLLKIRQEYELPWDSPKRIRRMILRLCDSDPECKIDKKLTGKKGRPPRTINLGD